MWDDCQRYNMVCQMQIKHFFDAEVAPFALLATSKQLEASDRPAESEGHIIEFHI